MPATRLMAVTAKAFQMRIPHLLLDFLLAVWSLKRPVSATATVIARSGATKQSIVPRIDGLLRFARNDGSNEFISRRTPAAPVRPRSYCAPPALRGTDRSAPPSARE